MADSIRTLETLELVGGLPCLDFVNTINSRVHPEHDYLTRYSDLVSWANRVEILSPAQAARLQKRARQNIRKAKSVLQRARTYRELLHRIFSMIARGSEPDEEDMESFRAVYGRSILHGRFRKTDDRYRPSWRADESLDALLWPIIHSAGKLLQSEELSHVKECPGCGWLFLDTSKNQSRRWCSMNTCGARDKMRRYHKRQRAR